MRPLTSVEVPSWCRRPGRVEGVRRIGLRADAPRPRHVWSPPGEAGEDDARSRVASDADGPANLAAVLPRPGTRAPAARLERLGRVEALEEPDDKRPEHQKREDWGSPRIPRRFPCRR